MCVRHKPDSKQEVRQPRVIVLVDNRGFPKRASTRALAKLFALYAGDRIAFEPSAGHFYTRDGLGRLVSDKSRAATKAIFQEFAAQRVQALEKVWSGLLEDSAGNVECIQEVGAEILRLQDPRFASQVLGEARHHFTRAWPRENRWRTEQR
jgi:hypothetical protein